MSETSTVANPSTTTRLPLAELPATVLPGAVITLALVTDQARRAVEAARGAGDGRVLLRAGDGHLAVVAQVPDIGALPTGEPVAIVRVESRARISAVHTSERGATYADAEILRDPRPTPRVEGIARELRGILEQVAELRRSRRLPEILRSGLEPGALADAVVGWADLAEERRREVLGALDVGERVDVVLAWAREHLAELQVAETIRNDVTEGVDRQQREFLLRQQLSAIRKELGEGDDDVVGEYRTKLETLEAADSAKNFIAKEIDRLERTSAQSPEQGWIRTWLDRVFELPWGLRSDDTIDLGAAQTVLDEDHYGLADVKSRIVEFLAVKKLRAERDVDDDAERSATKRGAGSIITLVGPPGVGKTSLGESIARAMGRKFVRVALGGIRDEAEIRGHRRTYVGSQPGRIVKAITEAGTMNPVVLLDEVDKMGAGAWSGDPTAALLEVLDPAQNHTFRDHYLELDLDLSEVVFIATANVLDTVPAPLLDRMDVVRLDGYTDAEKVFIAGRYLLPRQLQRAGLAAGELAVDDDTVLAVIRGYTREAGVRSLERELGRLARKAAAKIAAGEALPAVDAEHLHDWIGRAKVVDDVPERTELPGVATGLAVTGHGGDVLFIETTAFPMSAESEPGLTLTGQLGDVMKESAQIALNYVRSHAAELGVDPEAVRRRFHVHVPAGAVPKDGPSAGVTMTTALVSLLRDQPVKPTVGMTGEITLQGAVLPIGGLKQKVLAAHRAGLTEVVLPKRNEADLEDVPEAVRNEMTFHLAATYADVLAAAFRVGAARTHCATSSARTSSARSTYRGPAVRAELVPRWAPATLRLMASWGPVEEHEHGSGKGHSHSHVSLSAGGRHKGPLLAAFLVLTVFMVVEVVGGIVTNSLALLSDAGHMLTDVIGIGMALAAIHLAGRGSERSHRTFGWYRLEILAALANSVLLLGVAVYVLVEAINRFGDPVEVLGGLMLVIAILGLGANLVAFWLLRAGSKESLNVEGAYLEVLADTVGSVGVIVGAIVLELTSWEWVDPVVGIAIAVWIVPRTIRLAGQALRILVQAAPPGTDIDKLRADLEAVDGVVDVHDLHVWTLTSDMDVATAHLMVGASVDQHGVLDQARDVLRERYGIGHATLQVEPEGHTGCDEVGW